MPLPPSISTYLTPELGIGNAESLIKKALSVGDSFDETVLWEVPDPNAACDAPLIPADFTGYTPVAEILDKDGVALDTFAVTPIPGDATGEWALHLDPAQTTQALADAAKTWRFRIQLLPNFQETLFIAPFTLAFPP